MTCSLICHGILGGAFGYYSSAHLGYTYKTKEFWILIGFLAVNTLLR
jgi:hypothetical protein